jgi:hypothetical protein
MTVSRDHGNIITYHDTKGIVSRDFRPPVFKVKQWRTYKTSPRQNVTIQNVYTHNVSLTKRLRNETSPVTKRLGNKTYPGQI